MLTVACMRWAAPAGFLTQYLPEHVNVLRRMVARHYPHPHRFVCITDDPKGLDADIEVVPLWDDFAAVPSPHGVEKPSCYRRLKLFSDDMASVLGERFVSIDLDCVILGDMTPVWHRPDEFVICRTTSLEHQRYNGSMFMMNTGARAQVWRDFDPVTSPRATKAAGLYGSDQAWVRHVLGTGEATWGPEDGVYVFRHHVQAKGGVYPPDARVIFFPGGIKPWSPKARRISPALIEHWQCFP